MKKTSILLILLIYLGVYGSNVALWCDTQPKPLKIFPYNVLLYPEADQHALQHGIPITSDTEFLRLLEDYFS